MAAARKTKTDYARYVPFVGRERNLHMLLYLTEAALHEARGAQLAAMGLTPADSDLMFLVDALGESASPAALSRWFRRKPPTVSVKLDHMAARGLVERRPVRENKKSKRVVLTGRGRASLRDAMEEDVIDRVIGSLSEREYEQLWRLLEKLKAGAQAQARRLKAAGRAGGGGEGPGTGQA